jgi:hypothetical protein
MRPTDTIHQNPAPTYAVVTGASQGIGKSIALQLAQRNITPILVARSTEKLTALAEEIRTQHGLEPICLPCDLGNRNSVNELIQKLEAMPYHIAYAVNNAGFGDTTPFIEREPDFIDEMLELNIRALTVLTHFFARRFRAQGSGTIMNVASTAAFQPNPYFALYGATKAFVLNFDEAVNEELAGTNVRICTLCPGPTSTAFHDRASTGQSLITKLTMSNVEDVAKQAVDGMVRGRRIIVPGLLNKALRLSTRLAPTTMLPKMSATLMRPR